MSVRTIAARPVTALAALAVTGALTLSALPAEAAPGGHAATSAAMAAPKNTNRLGAVTGLTATATKPTAAYRVKATWSALTGAAAYLVSMLDGTGATLASGKVTGTGWTADTTLGAGSQVTVKVVPVTSTGRRGRAASTYVTLPDLTAPVGTYTASHAADDESQVTITQTSLTDDVSAAGSIVRAVNWDDDATAGFQPWQSGDTTTHVYAVDGVYHAAVRLTDQAGNTATVPVTIAVNDHVAPQGQFTAGPAKGWAKLTSVALTQVGLSDNFSATKDISRIVDWKDGTPATPWAQGTLAKHVYTKGGTFTPTVTVIDEAGNETEIVTTAVAVSVDSAAPVVRVRVPAHKVRFVDSWRTLRGRATDGAGVGLASASVKIVEKRGGAWFVYRPGTHSWAKTHLALRGALRKAKPVTLSATSTGRWSVKVGRLRKGTLVVATTGRDKVGNVGHSRIKRSLTR